MRVFLIHVGDPILDYVYDSLLELKHEAAMIKGGEIKLADLRDQVEAFKPDLIVMNNLDLFTWHKEGREMEEFLTSGRFALTTWYFEAPHMAGGLPLLERWKRGPYPKNILFLETDKGALQFYRDRKIPCGHLPLAVDQNVQHKLKSIVNGFSYPLVFAGSSIIETPITLDPTKENLARIHTTAYLIKIKLNCQALSMETPGREALINERLLRFADFVFSFYQEEHWQQSAYLAARDRTLAKVLAALDFGPLTEVASLMAAGALDVGYSFMQLSFCLEQLLSRGLTIFGSPSWQHIIGTYLRPTPRLAPEELQAVYERSKIVFCLTKRTFNTFVHERAFHVLAHGGFPLVDFREELPECFEKDEIASYHDLDHAKDLIDFYLREEAARAKIILKGRERVFKEHTYLHRTERLLQLSKEHYGLT